MSNSKPRFAPTESQREAIEAKDQDILVSASAGAGKTAALTEYIFRKIALEQVSVENILAMTFTEAAAQSMKKRLFQRLQLPPTQEELDKGYDAEFVKKQIDLLPSANISTIDSFCKEIVDQFSYLLGWDPDRTSRVFDENTLNQFKSQAAHEVVREAIRNGMNDDLIALVGMHSANGNHTQGLEEMIMSIGKEMSQYAKPEEWVGKVKAYYQAKSFDDLDPMLKKDYLFNVDKSMDILQKDLQDYYDQYIYSSDVYDQKVCTTIHDFIGLIGNWRKNLETHLEDVGKEVMELELWPSPSKVYPSKTVWKKDNEGDYPYEETNKNYDDFRKKLNEQINRIKLDIFQARDIGYQNGMLRSRVECLLELVGKYLARFQELKKENNGLDFQDMSLQAIALLEKKEVDVAGKYRDKFRYILVDEYQDSNYIQEKLIGLICRTNPYNVFRVGDVKQSIYKFRGAVPKLMRSMMEVEDKDHKVVVFENNFRSSSIIIQFNNLLYKKVMNIKGYDDTYTDEHDVASPGPNPEEQNAIKDKVELRLLDYDQMGKKDEAKDNPYSSTEYLANYIVQSIKEMEKDKEEKVWKDYVVLVRGNKTKVVLENAFKNHQVPYFFVVDEGYYDDFAVRFVVSYLRWLFDHTDEISMFSVATSPLYGYTSQQLAELGVKWKAIRYNGEKSKEGLLLEELPNLKEDYDFLTNTYKEYGLVRLVQDIINKNDFYYTKTTAEQRDNLDKFFERTVNAEADGLGLAEFLDWLDANEKADDGSATSISENANVVRVMTVHKSKGLEFPVVFYMATSLGKTDSGKYQMHEDYGLAIENFQLPYRLHYKSFLSSLMSKKSYQEKIEEEIRLMYVATTRPERKLVVCGFEKKDESTLFTAGGMEDLGRQVYAIGNIIRDAVKGDKEAEQLVDIIHVNRDDVDMASINRTDLVNDSMEYKTYKKEKESMKESSPSSKEEKHLYPISMNLSQGGAFRGTAIHKAFELLDFNHPDFDLVKERLDDEDLEKVKKFFNHPEVEEIKKMEIHKELPYASTVEGYEHGFMDLMAIDQEKIILVDYKSDKNTTKEKLISRYFDQQDSYRVALKPFNLPIRCYLYSLELDEFIEVPYEKPKDD